ncbi:MAG: DNA translocase FtsK [Ruminococcus sp.]|nr:DNA translocase FtsK [Candidatus Copronaster equi]
MAAKKTATNSKKSSAKTAKKPSGSTQSAKKNTKLSKEELIKKSEQHRQRDSLILLASAILLLAATLIKGEAVWSAIHNGLFGLFGICAFAWPLILIYLAILIGTNRFLGSTKSNVIGASVFVLLLSGVVHIFSGTLEVGKLGEQIKAVWEMKETITVKSAGFFGAIIGGIPDALFGKTAAAVVLIVLMLLVFMFVTRTTIMSLYVMIKGKRDEAKEIKQIRKMSEPESEPVIPRIKKKFVPIDIGPEAQTDTEDGMYIDELVGNAKKKENKSNKKEPKPFIDPNTGEVVDRKPDLEEIIRKVNSETEQKNPSMVPPVKTNEELKDEKKKTSEPEQVFHVYAKPPIDCLEFANNKNALDYEEELKHNAKKLVDTLDSFGVSTKIVDICRGPSVTRYELQPAAGVKISKITGLSDDIALALASSGVRIEAPIPNKSAVGIEIPNKNRATVSLREIIETPVYKNAKSKLNVGLGKDITGNTICADIAKMPHLLIAGTTGSGKSVCLNSMIVSILYNSTPDEVKLLMIDPKQVEFTIYNGIPHLLVPVVSDARKAAGALGWAVTEMLQRYKMFSDNSVRDIKGYNKLCEKNPEMTPMYQIVIFIDELSDLMMAAPNEVEDSICRLAQMARAAGMHLVIATQRPSVDVITGIIKANIPSRIALSVSSQVDSRTIIDTAGAEKLLGNGDMLFNPVGVSKPVRVQGCFLSDEEVENVVKFIKSQSEEKTTYDEEIQQEIDRQAVIEKKKPSSAQMSSDDDTSSGDEMIPKAIEVVVESQMASTTLLQRKLKLGYARAARIMDELEERKIVGPFEGSKPRKVLISKQQWMEMTALGNASAPIENPIETDADEDYE